MTTAAPTVPPASGDAFLLESEEHLAIARTVDQFWMAEVEPQLEAIRQQESGVALAVLRKSPEIQPRN